MLEKKETIKGKVIDEVEGGSVVVREGGKNWPLSSKFETLECL